MRVQSCVRTRFRIKQKTLIINLGGRRRVLSSAPQGGGFTVATHVLNHQVDSSPIVTGAGQKQSLPSASRYLRKLAVILGLGADTVGLMTAVPMTQLVTARASSGTVWVECFATVGVTNAVRAGELPAIPSFPKQTRKLGTINLVLVTNVGLSNSALVGAVQVATEAKTGVLRDHKVPTWTGRSGATGTGTDAVVIVCRARGQGRWHLYSGTHTEIGVLIGQAVAMCIVRGLAKARKWHERHR
jgi:iron complex transport system ATP-binding protein